MARKTAKRATTAPAQMRQGDVWFERVDGVPPAAKKAKGGTLALGEATGHHHSIVMGEYQRYEMPDGMQFVHVESPHAIVSHQEHAPVVLLAGTYKVPIQQEYVEGAFRNVLD